IVVPADRFDERNLNLPAWKPRSSIKRRMIRPTAPVAPTTATVSNTSSLLRDQGDPGRGRDNQVVQLALGGTDTIPPEGRPRRVWANRISIRCPGGDHQSPQAAEQRGGGAFRSSARSRPIWG